LNKNGDSFILFLSLSSIFWFDASWSFSLSNRTPVVFNILHKLKFFLIFILTHSSISKFDSSFTLTGHGLTSSPTTTLDRFGFWTFFSVFLDSFDCDEFCLPSFLGPRRSLRLSSRTFCRKETIFYIFGILFIFHWGLSACCWLFGNWSTVCGYLRSWLDKFPFHWWFSF